MNKKVENDLKDSEIYERMIKENSSFDIPELVKKAEETLPKSSNIIDYAEIKEKCEDLSKNIVDSIISFYMNNIETIKDIPYLKNKSEVDKITVSSLLFQMKTGEVAITKLLEKIDNGDTSPRCFEVLASLQKSKMEIVKHLQQFMVILENNYKTLKEDYKILKEETQEIKQLNSDEKESYEIIDNFNDEDEEGGIIVRGSKSLIDSMREIIKEDLKDTNENEEEI